VSTYRISELARRASLPASTLRFYEQVGLLTADRTASGYRMYDDGTAERLRFITSAKHLGLPLDEIRDLLGVWELGVCATVRARLRPLVAARIADADRRIAELSAFSAHLADVHQELGGPAPATGCGPGCGCVREGQPSPVLVDLTTRQRDEPTEGRTQITPVAPTTSCGAEHVEAWRSLLARTVTAEPAADRMRITLPAEPALAAEIATLVASQDGCVFSDVTMHVTPAALVLSVRVADQAAAMVADMCGA
jgi:DNA-binding transcriptional MerR regulator